MLTRTCPHTVRLLLFVLFGFFFTKYGQPVPRLDPTWRVEIAHVQLWGWRYSSCALTVPFSSAFYNTQLNHADWRIYASMNYVNIGLDNGLSPEQRPPSQYLIPYWILCWLIFNWIPGNKLRSFSRYLYFPWRKCIRKCRLLWNVGHFASWLHGTTGRHNDTVPQVTT